MTSQGANERALAAAVKAAQIEPRDGGGIQLARRYAQLLDAVRGTEAETETYADLGPKYLAALTALGLTLAGRGAKGGVQDGRTGSKLDELRDRRAGRAG